MFCFWVFWKNNFIDAPTLFDDAAGNFRHISRYAPRVEIIHVPNYVAQDDIPKTVVTPPEKSKTEIIYAGNMGVANDMETLLLAARILEKRGFADRLNVFRFLATGRCSLILKLVLRI